MTREEVMVLFEKLKMNVLSVEMLNAFPGYPKLEIKEYDWDQLNGECGNNMVIYLNQKMLNESEMKITEVLVHELYHFMHPGLNIFVDDVEEEHARESTVQRKAYEYCSKTIPNFTTDWVPEESYGNWYYPTNPVYWCTMQVYGLVFGLRESEFSNDNFNNGRIIFSQVFTLLSLDKDIDIDINSPDYTKNKVLNFISNPIGTVNELINIYNYYNNKNKANKNEINYFDINIDYNDYTIVLNLSSIKY